MVAKKKMRLTFSLICVNKITVSLAQIKTEAILHRRFTSTISA